MWADFLRHAIVAVGTAAALGVMLWLAKRPAAVHAATGAAVLRYNWMARGLAIASIGLTAVGPLAMWEVGPVAREFPIFAGYTVVFALLTVWSLLDAFRVWGAVTPEGIVWHTPWKGTQSGMWSEVTKVGYNGSARWFVIRLTDGRKIRVSVYIGGILALINALRSNVLAEKLEAAQNGFAEVEG